MGIDPGFLPRSRWQFEQLRWLPTKGPANLCVAVNIASPRRTESPSGPFGIALSGGGVKAVADTAWPITQAAARTAILNRTFISTPYGSPAPAWALSKQRAIPSIPVRRN